jgi:hypothetical protein
LVFGETTDGGLLAFWQNNEGTPIEKRPIVIFGSDGMVSVYAPHLLGLCTLLAHGCSIHTMEGLGFRPDAKTTRVAANRHVTAPTLKRIPTFAAALQARAPQIAKRKATDDRDAALALIPVLREAIATLRA